MDFCSLLELEKEPFSTSPDPSFFYQSREHRSILANLLIELRLKRGLSVVYGDIGTGKTTMSRKLVQLLKERENFFFRIILDPGQQREKPFLTLLVENFGIPFKSSRPTLLELKQALERFLFKKGIEENQTVVLIIDEAQK
jgi:general secretion pathway protein A